MKVVLFCGGMGMRLRDYSDQIPKPLVEVGHRPILWHLMKYYAHFGHKDFVLCLGYRGDTIKKYFLDYNECETNDFILSEGGRKVELLRKDISDWRITFVDTAREYAGSEFLLGEHIRSHGRGELQIGTKSFRAKKPTDAAHTEPTTYETRPACRGRRS